MAAARRFFQRALSLVRSGRAEAELAREIDSHLRLLEDGFRAQGLNAEDARYAARRAFGGVEQVKEHQRDARAFRFLAGWPMDLRLGARMLARTPGLTIVAVLALSIAIGGGVAYLELLRDHFDPSLPLPHADRVVGIRVSDIATGRRETRLLHDLQNWRAAGSFEVLGAVAALSRNLITEDGRSEPVDGVTISPSAFQIVPTPALLGRPLIPEDERPQAPSVVLIGARLWQSRFLGDPNVVGRTVRLGMEPHTIVGVMPEQVGFPANSSLWVPLKVSGGLHPGGGQDVRVFGRLVAGVSMEQASAELAALTSPAESDGATRAAAPLRITVEPYITSLSDESEAMWILYSLNVFFVGLLALCGTNVAALVFARTATREGELTVRTALGASRGRIVAQLLAEAAVLCALAAVIGVALATIGIGALNAYLRAEGIQRPFWWNDALSLTSLLYAAMLALVAAALIGIVPAMKATGDQVQARLKHAAAGSGGLQLGRLWTGMIVGQVAVTVFFLLSVVTLVWNATAGRQLRFAFDFPVAQYLVAELDLDRSGGAPESDALYRARFLARYRAIEERFEADGQIAGVTYAAQLPGLRCEEFWTELDGIEPASRPASGPLWNCSSRVAADFFTTFDAPILRGRTFSADEIASERDVAIVDETFVRLILGGRDPIGQRVRHQGSDERPGPEPWLTIVGVTRDLSTRSEKTTEDAVIYRPVAPGGNAAVRMLVRTRGDASGATDRVRSLAASAGADVRLERLNPLSQVYAAEYMPALMIARVLAITAVVALLLATAGVYSLMSFTLARRRREIGIRAALGAAPRRIVTAIFSRAFSQVGLGVVAGSMPGAALVAFGAPEVARGGGSGVALAAAGAVAALICTITVFACVVPARRALRIQPTDALRTDT